MAAKRFFVEYLEDSPADGLLTHSCAVMRVRHHFRKGPRVSPHDGFKRRRDLLRHITEINTATLRETVREYRP